MATSRSKAQCVTCEKEKIAYKCEGCLQYFCFIHLPEHHQELGKQLDEIEDKYNIFRETLNEQTQIPQKYSLIEQINQWENDSIDKIRQTAEKARQLLMKYTNEYINEIEIKLSKLTKELEKTRGENDFNEIDLNDFKQKLEELKEQLNKPSNISIQQNSSPFINNITVSTIPDVIYIGEVKSSAEQIDRAKKLQLPSTFYLYENKEPCKGCRGCEEDRLPPVQNGNKTTTTMIKKPTDIPKIDTKPSIPEILSTASVSKTPLSSNKNIKFSFTNAEKFQPQLQNQTSTTKKGRTSIESSSPAPKATSQYDNKPSIFGKFNGATGTSIFGNTTSLKPANTTNGGFLFHDFGAPTTTTAPTLFSGFGAVATTTTTPTLFSGFGAPTTTTAPTLFSGFGAVATTTTTTPTLFSGFGAPTTTTAPTLFSGFGAVATTTTTPTLFSGFGAATTTATTKSVFSNSPKFGIGDMIAKPPQSATSSLLFPTNSTNKKSATNNPFTFGTSNTTSIFGTNTTPSVFGAGTGLSGLLISSTIKPKTNVDDEAVSEDDSYEPNVTFKPIVQLPPVEVKTGEEDENVLFCERAKLYRFDPKTNQIKERGIGEMKILQHKTTNICRILMRREQVLKLCANHHITSQMELKPHQGSENTYVWSAMDFADNEAKHETLCVRFKTEERAKNFAKVFNDAKQTNIDAQRKNKT